jgi:hypothetical protein
VARFILSSRIIADLQCPETLAADPWASEPIDEIVCPDFEMTWQFDERSEYGEPTDETVAPDIETTSRSDERNEHGEPENGTAKQSEYNNEFCGPDDRKLREDIEESVDRAEPGVEDED